MADNLLRRAALAHAAEGRPVFPCRNEPGSDRHKTPLTPHGFKDATRDPKRIKAWWQEFPTALIGVPAGELFDVVDIDRKNGKDGFAHVPDWETLSPFRVRTPSGGVQLFFKPSGIKCRTDIFGKNSGVDTRGIGGHVCMAPSPGYELIGPPLEIKLSDLPPVPAKFLPMGRDDSVVPAFLAGENSGGGVSSKPDDTFAPPTELELEAALAVLDPDCDYTTWMTVGAALKDAPDGFGHFDRWSAQSYKYPGTVEFDAKFKEFAKLTQITVASLFHLAGEADPNWRPAKPSDPLPKAVVSPSFVELVTRDVVYVVTTKEGKDALKTIGIDAVLFDANPATKKRLVGADLVICPDAAKSNR